MENHHSKKSKQQSRFHNKATQVIKKLPIMLRILTDPRVFSLLASLILAGVLFVTGLDLEKNTRYQKEIATKRQQLLSDIAKWGEIVQEYKDYRDGYYNLAVLKYQLGDISNAKMELQKAFDLDPNFEAGKKLEKLIDSSN